ncbi:MAG TPA: type 2 lanthipeptide synthetase LanM family protein [Streptosporangiaceae bacterium]|nr:type 2 lanthipeptide synthetase LanM family protein [Streptosporangiaceae bacterium]
MDLPDPDRPSERLRPGWWMQALTGRERTSRPAWADIAEQAAAAAAPPDALPPMDSWAVAFAVPLRPFVAVARDRLADGARELLAPGYGDPGQLAGSFTAVLGRKLAGMAVRTMALGLAEARAGGRLTGDDGRARFADFLMRQSAQAGMVALFDEYPVLARLLGTATLQACEAGLELLARFAADRPALVETLLDGTDPGPVVAVEPGLGDPHRRGRSVTAVSFGDGRKVIYKPRSMDTYVLFCAAVRWLNRRAPSAGLRTAAVLPRGGYGWQEFVAHRPLVSPAGAPRFYQREGALLAVLYALNAVDIHGENLIAAGDQPVLVDAEALLHPILPTAHTVAADPAAQALATSVHRTALLPFTMAGDSGVADASGMGGDDGAAGPDGVLDWDPPATDDMRLIRRPGRLAAMSNRPTLGGRPVEPADHEQAILAGFRLGYDAITDDRQAFSRLIGSSGDIEARVIIRVSSGYARLLDESTDPDLLRDARDRQRALDVLNDASAGQPLWSRLARHELADLWAGDIPLLTVRPAASDIWTSTGQQLPGLLDQPGLSSALDKISELGELDRRDQEWIISASLATRRPAAGHRSTRPAPDPVPAVAPPGRLLTAACGLADQIVARGLTGQEETGQGRVNWLGLQLVEDTRWMVLPMGAGLADGYLGVALFLAQLAELTGVDRYAEVARRAVSAIPQLLDALAAQPGLPGVVGCGAAEGLGGISYGLARLATLLHDIEFRDLATMAIQLATTAFSAPGPPWWTSGVAGCLAAMTATAAELESAAAASLAVRCADHLAGLVERTDGRCVPDGDPVPPGFAGGPAGVGWALWRFAPPGAPSRYFRAAQCAVRQAVGPAAGTATGSDAEQVYGWCRGTAGLLVARTCLAGEDATAGPPSAVTVLTDRPVLADLSLCHGELGIAEALTVLITQRIPPAVPASPHRAEAESRAWRHRAGLILGRLYRQGPYCGTPGGVTTPGLLSGLAGIGYGLLRLGYPQRVPSALFLEPAPVAPRASASNAEMVQNRV